MHQDVFAEVPSGQAEVDEGGAIGQGAGQLKKRQVVIMLIATETFMDVYSPDSNRPLLIS